jgi:hypothetical protein
MAAPALAINKQTKLDVRLTHYPDGFSVKRLIRRMLFVSSYYFSSTAILIVSALAGHFILSGIPFGSKVLALTILLLAFLGILAGCLLLRRVLNAAERALHEPEKAIGRAAYL